MSYVFINSIFVIQNHNLNYAQTAFGKLVLLNRQNESTKVDSDFHLLMCAVNIFLKMSNFGR